MVLAVNNAERLSSVNHTVKAIHHLHHHQESKAPGHSDNFICIMAYFNADDILF